jgi:dTDP-glucose 4,6-dehydratase
MKLLVTGGAGFIGSAFVRLLISETDHEVVNLDKLTYAGNLANLRDVAGDQRYQFVQGDICDASLVNSLVRDMRPDAIVHFAAESHVDRSILSPEPAVRTNVQGTFNLLDAARLNPVLRFVHVSTDEVYGSLPAPAVATEDFPLTPSSPYSASKAGSDLLAKSYFTTFKLPVLITRASNNYGPYQFPEKLIPLMITNAFEDTPLPVYGDGMQMRDWLYVDDHCRGILAVLSRGREGEVYNLGGNESLPNLEVIHNLLAFMGKPSSLIRYVTDRLGHDRRYAISSEKVNRETGWEPIVKFDAGLAQTIEWYRDNAEWVAAVRSGEYRNYYERNYQDRGPHCAEPAGLEVALPL